MKGGWCVIWIHFNNCCNSYYCSSILYTKKTHYTKTVLLKIRVKLWMKPFLRVIKWKDRTWEKGALHINRCVSYSTFAFTCKHQVEWLWPVISSFPFTISIYGRFEMCYVSRRTFREKFFSRSLLLHLPCNIAFDHIHSIIYAMSCVSGCSDKSYTKTCFFSFYISQSNRTEHGDALQMA